MLDEIIKEMIFKIAVEVIPLLLVFAIALGLVLFLYLKVTGKKLNNQRNQNTVVRTQNDESQITEEEPQEVYPYKKKRFLLSKAENSFYNVLLNVLENEDIYVCPMVRLADVIYTSDTENRQRYFNKIQSKHIDFLLCNKQFLNPLLAIELDDSSHNQSDRVKRDDFFNNALKSAGLPLLRIKASYSYSPSSVKEQIDNLISSSSQREL